jgi:hypothetical protein
MNGMSAQLHDTDAQTSPRAAAPLSVGVRTSQAPQARPRALVGVEQSLRELAGNLVRVSIEAGEPSLITPQALTFIGAVMAFREELGELPTPEEFAEALALATLGAAAQIEQTQLDREQTQAERLIVEGALRMAASRLLGDTLQESIGKYGVYKGYWVLNTIQGKSRLRQVAAPEPHYTDRAALSLAV